jgi:hypothetical protein
MGLLLSMGPMVWENMQNEDSSGYVDENKM